MIFSRFWDVKWSVLFASIPRNAIEADAVWNIDARGIEANTKARVQRGERAVNAFVVRARSLIFAPRYFLLRTRRYTYRTRWPLRSDINLCIHCASLNANRSPTRPETYQQNSEYWNILFDDTWKLKLSEDYISIQFEQIIRRINLLNSYYKNWNRIIFTKFR